MTVTFVAVAAFARGGVERYAAARWRFSAVFINRWTIAALKTAGIAALALVLIAGFIGTRDPNHSIAPTLVWIVWWVGFSYLAMLIANLWPALNPWLTLYDRFAPRASVTRPWPQQVGAWPSVAALLAFGWLELVFPFRASPAVLAWLAVAYSIVTWVGMSRYGPRVWLRHADPFHRVFELFSRFAPLALAPDGKLVVRPYAAGLLESRSAAVPTAQVAFILGMLAIVLFDGFQASVHWVAIEDAVHAMNPQLGDASWIAIHTVGLLAMWLVFLGLYFAACRIAKAGSPNLTTLEYARAFAPTLIPIAVGYHFAHTFTYLIVQGQSLVFLVSDPFGLGWNLFGTAGAEVNEAVIGTRTAWYLALGAIVVGHAISVWLAHAAAERLLAGRGRVLRVLTPITVLMVLYTVISLQILAEPLVRYSGPQETII